MMTNFKRSTKVNQSSTVEQIYDMKRTLKTSTVVVLQLNDLLEFMDLPTPLSSKEVPNALLYNCHGIVVEYIKSLASDTLGP